MSLPPPSTQRIAAYPESATRTRAGADAWFDPLTSYPTFPLRRSQLVAAADQELLETDTSYDPGVDKKHDLYPHSFVPSTAQGERPDLVLTSEDDAEQKSTAAALPLDLFDSPELDLVPPAALLAAAAAEGREVHALSRHFDTHVRSCLHTCHGQLSHAVLIMHLECVRCLYLLAHNRLAGSLQGSCTWEPCRVLSFDEGAELFTIEWRDSGVHKCVKRLNLLLAGESRSAFRRRLQQARRRRAECESAIKFHRYVAAQPLRNRPLHVCGLATRLARRCGPAKRAAAARAFVSGEHALGRTFLADVAQEYELAVKRGIVLWEARGDEGCGRLRAAGVRFEGYAASLQCVQ